MNGQFKFYGRLLVRRAPVMLLLLLMCSGMGILLAMRLPTTYATEARLIVQPQQISEDLAASTVQIGALEEVRLLREQLLTRATLLEIARTHDVFEDMDNMLPNQIVERMRASARIEASGGRSQPVLVSVRFEGRSPQIVANVANDFVTRLTAENARIRTGAAGETSEFFDQEVERLATELDLRSALITEFQQANADALPGDQNFRLQRQTLLQERLSAAERERRNLIATRARTLEVFNSTGRVGAAVGGTLTPEERELEQLERDLSRALTVFSENAPQVAQIQRRIETLQEQVAAQAPTGEDVATGAEAILNLQLSELDAQIEALTNQIIEAETEIALLEDAISRTPLNGITLQGLNRDYENIRMQYDNAVQRLAQASVGERIEVTARGRRVSLIEPAGVPTSPASPNRAMIAAVGVGLGLALAAGFFLLMELLNRTVRRPAEIIARLGITPLATLPYMESNVERLARRSLRVAAAVVVVVGVPAALWAVDTYYLPLDILADRLINRFGLG